MSEEADLNPFPPMRTPIVLLESALVYLREIEPDPFAIIITGDFVNRAFVSGELGTREATKITEVSDAKLHKSTPREQLHVRLDKDSARHQGSR